MLDMLLEPFQYEYMRNALIASALVGTICAFLSAFLVIKGWSLIGDALSHAVVPGVAGAYILGLPFSVGAFFAGFLAAGAILFVKQVSSLREDAIIGFVFTTFFSAGILMISLYPTAINIESVILGNILMLGDSELLQIFVIGVVSFGLLSLFWKDLAITFFDENQAASVGISVNRLKVLFFSLLSATTVASLQAVGAVLVIALVIIPGATAYQLTDRFGKMIVISCLIGATTSLAGAYLSYFLDGVTGGVIVLLQAFVFFSALTLAPKYGLLNQLKAKLAAKEQSHA